MYAVIVTGREMRSGAKGNPILTHEGELFWIADEPDGWVEASSFRCYDRREVPWGVKVFPTEKAAYEFAVKWKGHPWWCSPTGVFEVLPIKPVYKAVLAGYEPA